MLLATETPLKDHPVIQPGAAPSAAVNSAGEQGLAQPANFVRRHIGPSESDTRQMLASLGFSTLEDLVKQAVPAQIRLTRSLQLPPARSEHEVLGALKQIAAQNQVFRS